MAFKKLLTEPTLGAKKGHHMGYATGAERPRQTTIQRNGHSAKAVLIYDGPLALQIPRDREARFRADAHPQALNRLPD